MYIITIPQNKAKLSQVLLLKWFKSKGEVCSGDCLCQVQAGQEILEIAAGVPGQILRILVEEGTMFRPEEPLAAIGQAGEDLTALEQYAKIGQSRDIQPVSVPAAAAEKEADSGSGLATNGKTHTKGVKMDNSRQPESKATEVIAIVMPQAGQSMEEGTIVAWKAAVGDRIAAGQVIFEIETDKAVMEVEAVNSGRIARIIAKAGDIVAVKEPVAYLAEEGVDIDAYLAGEGVSRDVEVGRGAVASVEPASVCDAAKPEVSAESEARVKASPAARKFASFMGINLSELDSGSGPGGRILSFDVANAGVSSTEARSIPISKMRRAIAKNLQYSKQNVPHFYVKATVEAQKLFEVYTETKADKFKCSLNDFIILATARAVSQYPEFRSQYKETEILELPTANIGIAVGTDNGLTVPVILAADKMTLGQLAEKTVQVVESARAGKLEGVGQGVFTITNLGMFGTEDFSAIINPPESGILAVGAIREGVKVENGAMRPTRLMNMTLSADHRVVDGVVAAKFMQTLQQLLESPQELLR